MGDPQLPDSSLHEARSLSGEISNSLEWLRSASRGKPIEKIRGERSIDRLSATNFG
jgi:hypothetical protein